MKLRLPNKLVAALMMAMSTATFTTLSTGSSAYATETPAAFEGDTLGDVMYIGDSITNGYYEESWRWNYFKILTDNGISQTEQGVNSGRFNGKYQTQDFANQTYGGATFKNDHSAYSSGRAWEVSGRKQGWGDRYLYGNIKNWLGTSTTKTDGQSYSGTVYTGDNAIETFFVLLGTNDFLSDSGAQGAAVTQNLLGWDGSSFGHKTLPDDHGNTFTPDIEVIYNTIHAQSAGSDIVMLTLPTVAAGSTNVATQTHLNDIQAYNEVLKNWATSKNDSHLKVVEVNTGLIDVTGTSSNIGVQSMFRDGLHPNKQGELIVSGNVAKGMGIGGRTAGLVRSAATADGWSHAEQDEYALGSSTLTFAENAFTTANGYTVDFGAKFGNGATDDWADKTNALSLSIGDGSHTGTLNMSEGYIMWGSDILYSQDNSVYTENIRIAYHNGVAADNVAAGYYVWLGDMLIGEGLSSTSGALNGVTLSTLGSGTGSIRNLSWADTAYAPTTIFTNDGATPYIAVQDVTRSINVANNAVETITAETVATEFRLGTNSTLNVDKNKKVTVQSTAEFSIGAGASIVLEEGANLNLTLKELDSDKMLCLLRSVSGEGAVTMSGEDATNPGFEVLLGNSADTHKAIKARYVVEKSVNFNGYGTYNDAAAKVLTIGSDTGNIAAGLTVKGDMRLGNQAHMKVAANSELEVRGKLVLGHHAGGDHPGMLTINGGDVKLGGVTIQNTTSKNKFVMNGGTLEFTAGGDVITNTSGTSLKTSGTTIEINGGTLKATDKSWTFNHNATLGNVTFKTGSDLARSAGTETITLGADGTTMTLNGTLYNTGNLALAGAATMDTSAIHRFALADTVTAASYSGEGTYAGSGYLRDADVYLIKNTGTVTGSFSGLTGTSTDTNGNVTFAVTDNTTYFVNSNLTYANAEMGGATYLNIAETATLTAGEAPTTAKTLVGSGTYALASGTKTLGDSVALDAQDWTGTVKLSGYLEGLPLHSGLGNMNSYVDIGGVSGSFASGSNVVNTNVIISENLLWQWGPASTTTINGTLSGSGDINRENKGGDTIGLIFAGDVSEYTGNFIYDRCHANVHENIRFEGNASVINAASFKTGQSSYGHMNITFAAADTVVNSVIDNTLKYSNNGTINAELNLTLEADTTFNNTVKADHLVLNNHTLTLGSHENTPAAMTIGGVIADISDTESESLTLNGNGTLTLNGANTFTGNVTLNGGTLKVGHDTALGAVDTSRTITVNSGAALDVNGKEGTGTGYAVTLNGGTLTNTGNDIGWGARQLITVLTLEDDSTINGTGRFGMYGPNGATTTLNLGNHTLEKTGNNTFTMVSTQVTGSGKLKVTQGIVDIYDYNSSSTGAFGVDIEMAGGTIQGTVNLADNITVKTTKDSFLKANLTSGAQRTLTFEGEENATLTLSHDNGDNSNLLGNVVVNSGTLQMGHSTALGAANGSTERLITINHGGTIDINGKSHNTAYVYTLAGGSLVNNGDATSDGNIQTVGLKLADDSFIGGTGNFYFISSQYGATAIEMNQHMLTKQGSNTVTLYSTAVSGGGTLRVEDGSLDITRRNSSKGDSSVDADIEVAKSGSAAVTGEFKLAGGHTITSEAANGIVSANITLMGATTLEAENGASLTLSGTLTGAGAGIAKTGEGTVVLSNAAAPSLGALDVQAGTLVLEHGATFTGLTLRGDASITTGGALSLSGAAVLTDMTATTSTATYSEGNNGFKATSDQYTLVTTSASGTVDGSGITSWTINGKTPTNATLAENGTLTTTTAATRDVYYVNEAMTFNNANTSTDKTSAATFNVAAGVTFTIGDNKIENKNVVLNTGATLKNTTKKYFDNNQMHSLTLEGDATVNVGYRFGLINKDSSDYHSTTLDLKGHTLTIVGTNVDENRFGLYDTTVEAGTIALNQAKLQLGHGGKTSTVDARDTLVTFTGSGASIELEGDSALTVEGLSGTGAVNKDGGSLTIAATKNDAEHAYTFEGTISNINLKMQGTGYQNINLTSAATVASLSLADSATLNLTGGTLTANSFSATENNHLGLSGDAALTVKSANGTALPHVEMNNGTLHLYSTASSGGTYTLNSLAVTGTDNLIDAANGGFHAQLDIADLRSTAAGAELTFAGNALVNCASVININGGDNGAFDGTLHVKQALTDGHNDNRHIAMNLADADVLSKAEISLESAVVGYNTSYVALGIATNATVKGITSTNVARQENILLSGSVALGARKDGYNGDGVTRTLTINTGDSAETSYTANVTVKGALSLTKQGAGTQSLILGDGSSLTAVSAEAGTLHFGGETMAQGEKADISMVSLRLNGGTTELSGASYTIGGNTVSHGLFTGNGQLVIKDNADVTLIAHMDKNEDWQFEMQAGAGKGVSIENGSSFTVDTLHANDGGHTNDYNLKVTGVQSDAATITANANRSYNIQADNITIANAQVELNKRENGGDFANKLDNSSFTNTGSTAIALTNSENTLTAVHAENGAIVVENAASSTESLKSIKARGADVTLDGLRQAASVSLNELVIGDHKTVSATNTVAAAQTRSADPTDADVFANIEVTGTQQEPGTLAVAQGGTMDKVNLGFSDYVSVHSLPTGGLNLNGGALTLSSSEHGSTIMLSDSILGSIGNTDPLALFTGVSSLTIDGTTYAPGDLLYGGTDVVLAGVVFANSAGQSLSGAQHTIIFRTDGDGTGTVYITPEPATTALSLLALAALAARRKRK